MEELPFPAIVNQRDLKTALLLNAINRSLGGVLIKGEKGTGKSTTVRGLKRVLPTQPAVADCIFNCHPADQRRQCESCRAREDPEIEYIETPVVELPLGATEDRVIGSIDIERALSEGVNAFEPGLLARANRGILYIDEVNLLDDYLVDVLLDVAASGVNRVEREGVSASHPAEFILVGTMNPAEGQLRPQMLDRFGLQVTVETPRDPEDRRAIVEITERFDRDPEAVYDRYAEAEADLRATIEAARTRYDDVELPSELEAAIVEICIRAGVEGHRGDILTTRCARTLAAFDGRDTVTESDVRTAVNLALPHRVSAGPGELETDLNQIVEAQFGDGEDQVERDEDDRESDAENGDFPSDDQRISQAGSRNRRAETNPLIANALDTLRSFLPPETDDEPADEPANDRDADSSSGVSGVPLDPIGHGSPPEDSEPEPLTDAFEDPVAEVLTRYDVTGAPHDDRTEADRRGRYVRARPDGFGPGSEVAIDATFRAAAERGTTNIERDDLQMKIRERKDHPTVVFAIDSSASMRAHGHLETVKEVMRGVFRDPTRQPKSIAAIAFRDETADLVVPPTSDIRSAAREIEELPTGNKTPLAHGLFMGMRLIQMERSMEPDSPATLVVLTDGRPTVSVATHPVDEASRVAERVAEENVGFVVVDLDTGRAGSDVCQDLAQVGNGAYIALDDVPSQHQNRRIAEAVWSAGWNSVHGAWDR